MYGVSRLIPGMERSLPSCQRKDGRYAYKYTDAYGKQNIVLTGPYGAGKSSIIETFLRKDEKDKCIVKGLPPYDTIRAFALKISMATFLKGNIVNNDSDEKIKLDADEIEKGILKQLFYKVEPNKIPQSRYRKLIG